MEEAYKFRVFLESTKGEPVDVESVLAWLKETSPHHLLVVKHEADADDKRAHWHALLFSSSNAQALRVALTRKVKSASGNYSLKEMPHSAVTSYTRYMAHGRHRGDEVVLVYTNLAKYTSAFLQAQNLQFWDDRAAFKKDKSKKDEDILSYCIAEAKSHKLTRIRQVAELVVDEYSARGKALYPIHLRAKILAVWYAIGDTRARREVIDEVMGTLENFSDIKKWPTSGSELPEGLLDV